jgi:hypothetical protein
VPSSRRGVVHSFVVVRQVREGVVNRGTLAGPTGTG